MTEYEIEIKAYAAEIEKVEQRLLGLGAGFIKTQREKDQYFNHPEKDFATTDEALRLRTIEDATVLTYKGPKLSLNSKARVEKEVGVESDRLTGEILVYLGFRDTGTVVKKRRYYELDGITACLDEVEGLGAFVELEKMGEDIEGVEEELYGLAAKLGLERFERRSYLELVLQIGDY